MTTKTKQKQKTKKEVVKKAKVIDKKPVVPTKEPFNGVKNIKSENDISRLVFVYFGATNMESEGSYGLSHLMEHLICKKFDKMMDSLQEDGITWNAFTADNKIVFEFSGLEEYIAKYRHILIKKMYQPFKLSAATLKKEIAIVGEEYDGVFTDLGSAHYHLFFRRYYNHYSAIGRKSDIEKFTVEQCKKFYDIQFSVPDIIINSSKTYELPEKGMKFANRYWHTKKLTLTKNVDDKEIEIINRLIASENKTLFHFREIEEKDIPVAMLVSTMLSDGLNSPLYQEVREKRGLVYGIGSSVCRICNLGGFLISASTSATNVKTVNKTIGEVLKHHKKYLTKERLELIRKQVYIQEKIEKCLVGNANDAASPLKKEFDTLIGKATIKDVHDFCEKYIKNLEQFTCSEIF